MFIQDIEQSNMGQTVKGRDTQNISETQKKYYIYTLNQTKKDMGQNGEGQRYTWAPVLQNISETQKKNMTYLEPY